MRKVLAYFLTLLLTACGSFQITIQINPTAALPPTWTPPPPPTATDTPTVTSSPTPTGIRPTPTVQLTPTPGPTGTPLPPLQEGQSITITALRMFDETAGWGVESAGHLLRTSDGGGTWLDVTPPQGGIYAFLDAQNAWATLKSSDSCEKALDWNEYRDCMPLPPVTIWRTSDGGRTWRKGTPFYTRDTHYKPIAIQFVNATTGWFLFVDHFGPMGGHYERIARTDDGGLSWTVGNQELGPCNSPGMIFTSKQEGWIGMDCRFTPMEGVRVQDFFTGRNEPVTQQTTDGGASWDDYPLPVPKVFPPELTAPDLDPATRVYCGSTKMDRITQAAFMITASCSKGVTGPASHVDFIYGYLTPDRGQTWHSWLATGSESFLDSDTGWRLFSPGPGQSNQLQQTTDGGLTWTVIRTIAWQDVQFDFVNDQVGWAIAGDGVNTALVHTTNGGKTWAEIKPVVAGR